MDEGLYHHGVKGMKWGVRRTPAQLGHKTSAKKKTSKKDKIDEITKKINEYSLNFESSRKARSERKQTKLQEKTAEQKAREERKQAKEATKQAKEATKQAKVATKQMEKSSKKPEPKKQVKKPLSELSDEELRERINRLEMEQKYKNLVASNNPKVKNGKDVVNEILTDVGKDLAKQTIKHYGAKGINRIIGEDAVYANNKKK